LCDVALGFFCGGFLHPPHLLALRSFSAVNAISIRLRMFAMRTPCATRLRVKGSTILLGLHRRCRCCSMLFDQRRELARDLLRLAAVGLELAEQRKRDLPRRRRPGVERVAVLVLVELAPELVVLFDHGSELLSVALRWRHPLRAARRRVAEDRAASEDRRR